MATPPSTQRSPSALREHLWQQMGGAPEHLDTLSFEGPKEILPSVFGVTELAGSTIGLATLAVAEWRDRLEADAASTKRTNGSVAQGRSASAPSPDVVRIDRTHAGIAFRSERYLERPGLEWPSLWDSMAGDYATRAGFIRLHTNYAHHRAAAERVLGPGDDREDLARRIEAWSAEDLESEIVAAGGCAAAQRAASAWAAHPQGRLLVGEPTLQRQAAEPPSSWRSAEPVLDRILRRRHADRAPRDDRPLQGVRVLDLTRVIAGPVCTRFLAAWGATVLRIDPPGFAETDPLVAETTAGKRCAGLDLRDAKDREVFRSLVAEADILVHGYRSDALPGLGFDTAALREIHPTLVIARLDAYGFEGPWSTRRGFDSLVQMSCGIADRGQAFFGTDSPKPLPAQALDHGSGYLLAAAVCRALCDLHAGGSGADIQLSLAGTAQALMSLGEIGDPECPEPDRETVRRFLVEEVGDFGRIERVACPGSLGGQRPFWNRPASRLTTGTRTWDRRR